MRRAGVVCEGIVSVREPRVKPQDRARYLLNARSSEHARRVDAARRVMLRALDIAGSVERLAVFTSWGSDSVPLCDLALDVAGATDAATATRPLRLVHIASTYEIPGGEAVVEHFAARGGARIETIPPARTLDETIAWLRTLGLDHSRTSTSAKKAGNRAKAEKGTAWAEANGCTVQVLGMRASETLSRRKLFAVRGPIYEARGITIACPMASWSPADVWAYTVAHGLPWHPLYDCETLGHTRETLSNTGWLTTHGAQSGRIAWLRRHYPELYERLLAEWPELRGLG